MSVVEFLLSDRQLRPETGPGYVQPRRCARESVSTGIGAYIVALPPATVQRAIRSPADTDAVRQRQGSDPFVSSRSEQIEPHPSHPPSFFDDMSRCGNIPTSLLPERGSCLTSGRIVEFTQSLYRGDARDPVTELMFGEK